MAVDCEFRDPAVEAAFAAFAEPVRSRLLDLRRLILETAAEHAEVGELEEALRWGQPSYLTVRSRSGSTIRIDQVKGQPGRYALYFHCKTDMAETFRTLYSDVLEIGGKRSLLFNAAGAVPEAALRHCIALALTYHQRKRWAR